MKILKIMGLVLSLCLVILSLPRLSYCGQDTNPHCSKCLKLCMAQYPQPNSHMSPEERKAFGKAWRQCSNQCRGVCTNARDLIWDGRMPGRVFTGDDSPLVVN